MSNPVTHLPRTIHHFNLTFKHNAFFKAHTLPTEYNRNKIQLLYTYTEKRSVHNIFHTQAREKKGGTICAPLERNKREKQFKLRGAARGEGGYSISAGIYFHHGRGARHQQRQIFLFIVIALLARTRANTRPLIIVFHLRI